MPQLGDLLARIALGETLGMGEAETLRLEFNNLQSVGAIARKWAAPNGELDLSFLPIRVLYSKRLAEDTASITIQVPPVINNVLVFGNGRSTEAAGSAYDDIRATFNGDTGNNYNGQNMYVLDTALVGKEGLAMAYALVGSIPNALSVAGLSGQVFAIIPNCQNTSLGKTILAWSGNDLAANSIWMDMNFCSWNSTSRVSSIVLALANGNWVSGSMISVIGIV